MSKPTLLAYNLKDERRQKIQLIAMRLAIQVRHVQKPEYERPIGDLLSDEETAFTPYEGEGFPDEMLVMAHFRAGQLNKFLDAFRQMRVPPVKLKAVLTDTNRAWHSLKLQEDLKEESAYFGKLRKVASAKQAMQEAQKRHEAQEDGVVPEDA